MPKLCETAGFIRLMQLSRTHLLPELDDGLFPCEVAAEALSALAHSSSFRAEASAQEEVGVFEQHLRGDAALDPVVDPLRTASFAVPELLGDLQRPAKAFDD